MATPPAAPRTALDESSGDGAFVRTPAAVRGTISAHSPDHPPAGDKRYWLVVSWACPWANRTLVARAVRGLEGAVGVSVVHPTWQRTRPGGGGGGGGGGGKPAADTHTGWVFCPPHPPSLATSTGCGAVAVDGVTGPPPGAEGCASVRDLYELAGGAAEAAGKFSVPVLWDAVARAVVNNESSDIARLLDAGGPFDAWAAPPAGAPPALYPPPLRPQIDALNAWIYASINDGVYKCGFARSQKSYDEAAAALLAGLRRVEGILAASRFLSGPALTEADVRLVQTLVRYDAVYVIHFKCAAFGFIAGSPTLRGYLRDVLATPGLAGTVRLDHIKAHYFTSHPALNPYGIIPLGPVPAAEGGAVWWEEVDEGERAARAALTGAGG